VAIARALFNDPPIIMADEPTGALDSKTGETVMKLLRMLCRTQKKTIIVVTHDLNVARYASRIIRLRDGRIVEDRRQQQQPDPEPAKMNVWQAAEELLIAEAEDVEESKVESL
jgi:ABC-type lipoprotein export system ATPase subunit